jgi:uncharacterized protein YfaP (DUF2135 family)
MRKAIFIMFAAVVAGLALSGCNAFEDIFGKKTHKLTTEELAQITSDRQSIELTAGDIIQGKITSEDEINQLLAYYNQLESVENAKMTESGLFVKFRDFGTLMWIYDQPFDNPPFFDGEAVKEQIRQLIDRIDAETKARAEKIFPGNKKVALFCPPEKTDGNLEANGVLITELLRDLFTALNFEVTTFFGAEATVESFKHLHDFGTVIITSHGSTDPTDPDSPVYLTIGETLADVDVFYRKYGSDCQAERIGGSYYGNNGNVRVAISEKFIDHCYSDNALNNTMFYMVACYGMSHDMKWGKVLQKKRKRNTTGMTVGYDNSNNIGHTTAWYLFSSLLSGFRVRDGFADLLPVECRHNSVNDGVNSWVANLVGYPDTSTTSGSISYGNPPADKSITITHPLDGQTYSNRVLRLAGICSGFSGRLTGVVRYGASTTPLNFLTGGVFEQTIVIANGWNTIQVVVSGLSRDRSEVISDHHSIEVYGDFAAQPLYTELLWDTYDTDVDLHLTGPDGEDCYYYHKTASWGGYLDVDDIDGIGPEHITIPELRMPGRYTLWVHYFADRGHGSSQPRVWVETPHAGVVQFGPHVLNQTNDTWILCEIEYDGTSSPDGRINVLNLRSSPVPFDLHSLPPKR